MTISVQTRFDKVKKGLEESDWNCTLSWSFTLKAWKRVFRTVAFQTAGSYSNTIWQGEEEVGRIRPRFHAQIQKSGSKADNGKWVLDDRTEIRWRYTLKAWQGKKGLGMIILRVYTRGKNNQQSSKRQRSKHDLIIVEGVRIIVPRLYPNVRREHLW